MALIDVADDELGLHSASEDEGYDRSDIGTDLADDSEDVTDDDDDPIVSKTLAGFVRQTSEGTSTNPTHTKGKVSKAESATGLVLNQCLSDCMVKLDLGNRIRH
jgi:hypothetical protein